jgi:hypothetical protein
MKPRGWIGITAIVQAVGVSSLHAVVKTPWLLVSILVGIAGFLSLIFLRGQNKYDSAITSTGDFIPVMTLNMAGLKLVICSTVLGI